MRGRQWTAESIALLRKLWSDGATAVVIADRLGGISRSAVLGKVFRLRLHIDDAAVSAQRQHNAPANQPAVTPARRRRSGARNRRAQAAPPRAVQRKTLFELSNNTCRWPHGRPGSERFFFCGALEADLEKGIPYCARHMRRAYPGFASPAAGGAMSAGGARRPSSAPIRVDLRSLLLTPRAL